MKVQLETKIIDQNYWLYVGANCDSHNITKKNPKTHTGERFYFTPKKNMPKEFTPCWAGWCELDSRLIE